MVRLIFFFLKIETTFIFLSNQSERAKRENYRKIENNSFESSTNRVRIQVRLALNFLKKLYFAKFVASKKKNCDKKRLNVLMTRRRRQNTFLLKASLRKIIIIFRVILLYIYLIFWTKLLFFCIFICSTKYVADIWITWIPIPTDLATQHQLTNFSSLYLQCLVF